MRTDSDCECEVSDCVAAERRRGKPDAYLDVGDAQRRQASDAGSRHARGLQIEHGLEASF